MKRVGLFCFITTVWIHIRAQDTFSILAYDSLTREVGAAGASCLDLFQANFPTDHFIAEIFPDTGAIATQAQYVSGNQANARARMRAGDSPAEIVAWLNANDLGIKPETRQYGVIRFGEPTAAFSGTQCLDYKGHRKGPNYSIQGNILLGPKVLDTMEYSFLNAKGDLACKLMAAMQAAKMKGADSRCSSNNTSSLFAFLKVSIPQNNFGAFDLIVSLRTHSGDSIEPIDSLQKLFDLYHICPALDEGLHEQVLPAFSVHPNPALGEVKVTGQPGKQFVLTVSDPAGRQVLSNVFSGVVMVDIRGWAKGLYFFEVREGHRSALRKVIIE